MSARTDLLTGHAPTATPVDRTGGMGRWAAHVAARRPALRRAARGDLLRGALVMLAAAFVTCAALAVVALPAADRAVLAGTGIVAILCAFVWAMAWSATHTRPAPPVRPPDPSPCPVCGRVPTLRELSPLVRAYWWIGCPGDCEAHLCAVGQTPRDAWAAWESVVTEVKRDGARPEPPPPETQGLDPAEAERRRLAWVAGLPAWRQREIAEREQAAQEWQRNRARRLTPTAGAD